MRTILYLTIPLTVCLLGTLLVVIRPWAETSLEITVHDSVSSSWVWGVSAKVQNRTALGYLTTRLRFTGLKPGNSTLEVSAPSYTPVSVPLRLRRGVNVVPSPVVLVGYEIPGLAGFVCFEQDTPGALTVDLRPIDTDRTAITHHPALDLKVGCLISEQKLGGRYARETSVEEPERGKILLRNSMRWSWDDAPDAVTRYQATLELRSVKLSPAMYWFVDYLIIVPDPRAVTPEETAQLLERALAIDDEAERSRFLAGLAPRARGFDIPAWNVNAVY